MTKQTGLAWSAGRNVPVPVPVPERQSVSVDPWPLQSRRGLARTGGNKTRLARDLGMSRVTLAKKIKEYT